MIWQWAVWIGVGFLTLLPTLMFWRNLRLFLLDEQELDTKEIANAFAVSVLIPARDEASSIEQAVTAALASENIDVEVVVMDDGSTDGTDSIVNRLAAKDPRVVYRKSAPLPQGWNGKQHACWQLAQEATHARILFIDADVRMEPNGLAILCQRQDRSNVALLSAFPRQVTVTFWEKLLIPMMHYILLCFLPFHRMRGSVHPAYAAGCGQLFMTKLQDYQKAGTHECIKGSRHDGVKLPRAYRQAGLGSDVVDGSQLASCRMYRSGTEVFRGLLKNATEGIANPRLIGLFTVLLIGAGLAPFGLLAIVGLDNSFGTKSQSVGLAFAGFLCLMSYIPRTVAASRLQQSKLGALFHPVAILVFVILQWTAFALSVLGRQVAWRGRVEK